MKEVWITKAEMAGKLGISVEQLESELVDGPFGMEWVGDELMVCLLGRYHAKLQRREEDAEGFFGQDLEDSGDFGLGRTGASGRQGKSGSFHDDVHGGEFSGGVGRESARSKRTIANCKLEIGNCKLGHGGDGDGLISVEEAAGLLGLSVSRVRGLMGEMRIKYEWQGRRRLPKLSSVLALRDGRERRERRRREEERRRSAPLGWRVWVLNCGCVGVCYCGAYPGVDGGWSPSTLEAVPRAGDPVDGNCDSSTTTRTRTTTILEFEEVWVRGERAAWMLGLSEVRVGVLGREGKLVRRLAEPVVRRQEAVSRPRTGGGPENSGRRQVGFGDLARGFAGRGVKSRSFVPQDDGRGGHSRFGGGMVDEPDGDNWKLQNANWIEALWRKPRGRPRHYEYAVSSIVRYMDEREATSSKRSYTPEEWGKRRRVPRFTDRMEPWPGDRLICRREAAEILGVSLPRLSVLAAEGALRVWQESFRKPGCRAWFSEREVRRYAVDEERVRRREARERGLKGGNPQISQIGSFGRDQEDLGDLEHTDCCGVEEDAAEKVKSRFLTTAVRNDGSGTVRNDGVGAVRNDGGNSITRTRTWTRTISDAEGWRLDHGMPGDGGVGWVDHGEYFRGSQAAAELGISTSSVRVLRVNGRLEGHRLKCAPGRFEDRRWWFYKKEDVWALRRDRGYLGRRLRGKRAAGVVEG